MGICRSMKLFLHLKLKKNRKNIAINKKAMTFTEAEKYDQGLENPQIHPMPVCKYYLKKNIVRYFVR